MAGFSPGARVPIGYSVSFRVATPPASKKNGRRIFQRLGKTVSLPSAKAEQSELDVGQAALAAIGHRRMPFHADDTVALHVIHDVATDVVEITVEKVGELPSRGKKGTKRDCHGMIETIADALEGVLYPNDRAVDSGTWERAR